MRHLFIFLVSFIYINETWAGIIVGATRIIYNTSKGETEISVKNPEKNTPYLVQSWIEDIYNIKNSSPHLIVAPPLFRISPGQENIIRIIPVKKDYPQDRESVYWLNIKSVSSSQPTDQNQLQISVKTRIKIFVRPAHLTTLDAENAYKALRFDLKNGLLSITNPTPFYVSFFSIKIDNTQLKNILMVAPFSSTEFPARNGKNIIWSAINDYGGITKEIQKGL